ncbi:tRNA (adenosine(37)-N6)-threonylcarbamoyltransferase complex ATPase subunit type 1 TsaE [Candidatus Babeliales bacterium]|nr:tRNA (adenosine(37)-N6)-threonylcarbamoyltransferase complex ATPase subunit type 1 TsaE [Candidatus Babeliales bacterium]
MHKVEYSIDAIDAVARRLWQDCVGVQVITLSGGLGAGKTTLTQALVRTLGVQEPVSSPTFTYVNMYHGPNNMTVYHFDLYRLTSFTQFEAAGFFEYLYAPNSIAIIEWPEIVMPFLTHHVCNIQVSVVSETKRLLQYDYKV